MFCAEGQDEYQICCAGHYRLCILAAQLHVAIALPAASLNATDRSDTSDSTCGPPALAWGIGYVIDQNQGSGIRDLCTGAPQRGADGPGNRSWTLCARPAGTHAPPPIQLIPGSAYSSLKHIRGYRQGDGNSLLQRQTLPPNTTKTRTRSICARIYPKYQ